MTVRSQSPNARRALTVLLALVLHAGVLVSDAAALGLGPAGPGPGDAGTSTAAGGTTDSSAPILFAVIAGLAAVGVVAFLLVKRSPSAQGTQSSETTPARSTIANAVGNAALPGQPAAAEQPTARGVQVPPVAARDTKIFVSYRRDDSADVTGRIYDRLTQHFGKAQVFKDVDSIPFGVDFRVHLHDRVGECKVLLVVIGDRWQGGDANRLHDAKDYVRIELEAALKRGIPVIPVLVRGAAVPDERDLPETLASLTYRNGIGVRPDPDFHRDMDRLIEGIGQLLAAKP